MDFAWDLFLRRFPGFEFMARPLWAGGFKLRPAQAGDFGPDNRSLAHKSLGKKRQNVLVALVKFSTPQGKI